MPFLCKMSIIGHLRLHHDRAKIIEPEIWPVRCIQVTFLLNRHTAIFSPYFIWSNFYFLSGCVVCVIYVLLRFALDTWSISQFKIWLPATTRYVSISIRTHSNLRCFHDTFLFRSLVLLVKTEQVYICCTMHM